MKKLLLSALFATTLFSAPAMAKVEPDIIRTTYGDFDAQGQLLSANETALKAMDFKVVENNANKGDATAQFHLAKMYELGVHTQTDEKKAIEWYKKSAENGNAFAMNNYAYYLSENEALEWFKKASDLNQPHAKMALAMYYINSKSDIQKGVDLLLELGENGFAPAYLLLSQLSDELPTDIYQKLYPNKKDSVHHIIKSAEMGYSHAQVYLAQFSGMLFFFGADIDENGEKADDDNAILSKSKQNIVNSYGWAKRACNNGNELGCQSAEYYDELRTRDLSELKKECESQTDQKLKQDFCRAYEFNNDIKNELDNIYKRYE
ncbi:Polar organelle development protein [Moraxella caprae]|uniref:Polar organelle development protein n=1 Tax=Moraxella caprae TaxID=90240 RepID=A0A378R0D0_9GAMM|nr:tetratricopeptide repeat protein [Moraxella caprae]STZ08478.1 Polar organelle development protein [Moraxella caprae]